MKTKASFDIKIISQLRENRLGKCSKTLGLRRDTVLGFLNETQPMSSDQKTSVNNYLRQSINLGENFLKMLKDAGI